MLVFRHSLPRYPICARVCVCVFFPMCARGMVQETHILIITLHGNLPKHAEAAEGPILSSPSAASRPVTVCPGFDLLSDSSSSGPGMSAGDLIVVGQDETKHRKT